jgi:hypothetical protein
MTDGQSASLSWNKAPIWDLRPDFYYCQTVADLLMWGAFSLWREDGSVVYNCSWPLPVQTFSGPTPMGLVTIICCLRFETSLFVASYDSQGYGGGIRPRLHTGDLFQRSPLSFYNPSVRTAEKTQPFYCCLNSSSRKCVYSIFPKQRLYASHFVSWQFLYCCVRAFPSNGCFSSSPVVALSKYSQYLHTRIYP